MLMKQPRSRRLGRNCAMILDDRSKSAEGCPDGLELGVVGRCYKMFADRQDFVRQVGPEK